MNLWFYVEFDLYVVVCFVDVVVVVVIVFVLLVVVEYIVLFREMSL